MAKLEQVLNYVKQINEKLILWESNAKKAEELPIMEIMDPEGLLIISELIEGVWVSKQLQVQKIIDGLSLSGQDNKVREVLLGTITDEHDLNYLLDNNGITVSENEIIVLTVLTTIDAVLIQKQFLWKLGKGEYNPIGSTNISTKLIELQPRFLNDITAEELTSSPSAIVYDFGVITGTILDVLNTADPARDYTDDEKIYYIRATKDDVNLLYNFVGTNGIYGDGELQMTESDLVLVYSSANSDITDLLNNKLDKGTYTGDAGGLNDRITVLEDFNPIPKTGFTGKAVAAWSGTGLKFDYVFPKYYLEGVEYPAISGDITLTAADPTNPRFTTIIADASGVNEVLGVAQENPPTPSLDPNTQLFVINVLINAGETTPANTSQSLMYDEGVEWTTYANHANITFDNTVDPLSGANCINVANSVNGTYFELTAPEPKNIVDADGFKHWIKNSIAIATNRGFKIAFYNGSTRVSKEIFFQRANGSGGTIGPYGFDYTNISIYQLLAIPFQDLEFSASQYTKVRFTFIGVISVKLDYIALMTSGGGFGTSPDKKGIKTIITNNGSAIAETSEDTFKVLGRNGAETSASGKTIFIDVSNIETLYHKLAWATAGNISITGTTATSSAGVFEADMVGARISIGTQHFVISSYSSASSVEVALAATGTVTGPNGSWGVYNRAVEISSTGLNLYGTSSSVPASIYSESTMILPNLVTTIGSLIGITPDSFQMTSGVPLVWRSGDLGTDGSRDVGIRRNAAGVLEIFDGITAGQYRDMVVRNISGATATAPEHYVPLAQMEAADDDVLAAANSYTDAGLALKLDITDYNDRFKGVYVSEAALNSAYPTANAGDSAQVNEVGATDVVNYSWDAEENIWVNNGSGGSGATNTDALPEGSTNLYFTTARVLATVLTGLSLVTGGAIVSTDSVLVAFGKIQKQINDISTALGAKITANSPITGSTKTKVTYDANGLVTGGADATTADIADSTNKRYVTDAQQTVIGNTSGTNSGNETTTTIGALIGGAGDATPNDTDYVATALTSGGLLKKITWINVKAFLKTYFDTVYQSFSTSVTNSSVTGSYPLDWSKDTFILTLTGATTFAESNLPSSGKTKVISLYVTGVYALTYPSGWSTRIVGAYNGAVINQIVVEYLSSGSYWVTITQPS